MKGYPYSGIEKIVLALVAVVLLTGFALFYSNVELFNRFVVEDGLVEWLTVLGLLLGCAVCVSRFSKLTGKRNWWFLTVTLVLGIILFFGAGEEISWGQRLLHLKPPEFFNQNNAQHETNFHNLVVGGVKLNKLIFSLLLSIAMGIYLVLVPILYEKNQHARAFLNFSGVPVARMYQVVSFILLIVITTLLRHEKNAELLECGTALLFFLIIRYPRNDHVFVNNKKPALY